VDVIKTQVKSLRAVPASIADSRCTISVSQKRGILRTGLISVSSIGSRAVPFAADLRQLHPGQIRIVHRGGLPGRISADFGGAASRRRRSLVRHFLGTGDLLQRNIQRVHHPQAAQAQQRSDRIQLRFQDGVQDDQEVRRGGALRESLRR